MLLLLQHIRSVRDTHYSHTKSASRLRGDHQHLNEPHDLSAAKNSSRVHTLPKRSRRLERQYQCHNPKLSTNIYDNFRNTTNRPLLKGLRGIARDRAGTTNAMFQHRRDCAECAGAVCHNCTECSVGRDTGPSDPPSPHLIAGSLCHSPCQDPPLSRSCHQLTIACTAYKARYHRLLFQTMRECKETRSEASIPI